MTLLRKLGGALSLTLLLGLLVASVPAGAQTLTALSIERTVALSNVLTTITPTASASVLAAIAAGTIEIREQTNLNPQQNTLTATFFVVPTGSPTPTNLSQLPGSSVVAQIVLSIANVYITSKPAPAVLVDGNVSQSSATPYGNPQGTTASYSFGYTTDTPPKINNVVYTAAGQVVIWSAAGSGAFTITNPGGGGGGGAGSGVTVVINGLTSTTPTFQTTLNQIVLDASKSNSTNAGALTYSWTVTSGVASISFPFNNPAIANIQLGGGRFTTATIKLVVTDATGASTTVIITIQVV